MERTRAALAHPPGRTVVPVDEVDEIRIVASWVADNEPPELSLDPAPSAPALMRFAAAATTATPFGRSNRTSQPEASKRAAGRDDYLDVQSASGRFYGATMPLDGRFAPDATPVTVMLNLNLPRVWNLFRELMTRP